VRVGAGFRPVKPRPALDAAPARAYLPARVTPPHRGACLL